MFAKRTLKCIAAIISVVFCRSEDFNDLRCVRSRDDSATAQETFTAALEVHDSDPTHGDVCRVLTEVRTKYWWKKTFQSSTSQHHRPLAHVITCFSKILSMVSTLYPTSRQLIFSVQLAACGSTFVPIVQWK